MATAKQIAANRRNAQKNTDPRSVQGKAISRFNALKHGIFAVHRIMFDEKPEDLAELSAGYHAHHSPADPGQPLLVDALVHNERRLRRMRRVEAVLWQSAYGLIIVKNIEVTSTCTSGDAFATDSSTFERLQRVVMRARLAPRPQRTGAPPSGAALSPPNVPANPDPLRQKAARTSAPAPQPPDSTGSSANLVSFRQIRKPRSGSRQTGPVTHLAGPGRPVTMLRRGRLDPAVMGALPMRRRQMGRVCSSTRLPSFREAARGKLRSLK